MKMLQISHEDLQTLEECLPQLTEAIGERTSNADRAMIRRVQAVLTRVRWDYQPHTDIQELHDEPQRDQ